MKLQFYGFNMHGIRNLMLVSAALLTFIDITGASELYNRATGEYTANGAAILAKLPTDKAKIKTMRIINSPHLKTIPHLNQMINLELIDLSNGNMRETKMNSLTMIEEDIQLQALANLARNHKLHTIIMPNSYTSLYNSCFSNCFALRSLTANTVKFLDAAALQNCISLEELNIHNAIGLGENALSGCRALQSLTISPLINAYRIGLDGKYDSTNYVKPSTFFGVPLDCIIHRKGMGPVSLKQFLRELSKPVTVNSNIIKPYMDQWLLSYQNTNKNPHLTLYAFQFMKAMGMYHAEIPNAIAIFQYAFSDDISLEYADIRNALIVAENSFQNCVSLKAIFLSKEFNINNIDLYGRLISFPRKNNIQYAIYPAAFIAVPKTCTVMRAGMNNTSLRDFLQELSSSVSEKTSFTDYAQYSNYGKGTWISSYQNLNVEEFRPKSFSCCVPLRLINAPVLNKISNCALEYCTNLELIIAPKTKVIDDRALFNCQSVKSLEFPMLQYLGWQSLKDCFSLESITFPADIQVRNEAFANCDNLRGIIFTVTKNTPRNITVDLKRILLDTYSTHSIKTYKQINIIGTKDIPADQIITIRNAGYDGHTITLSMQYPVWIK